MRKKLHPITFDACGTFTETKQWMLAQWGGGWRVSVLGQRQKDTPRSGQTRTAVTPWNEEHLNQLIHANWQITTRELCTELSIGFNVFETMVPTLEYRIICARWAPQMLTREHQEHHIQVCWDLLNQYNAGGVSWITSSQVTGRGVTTTSQSQNGRPWSGDMWIPHRRKSSRCCPQWVKWCALSFGIGKGCSFRISLNLDTPSTLTATSRHWLSWRLKFPESGQRRRQPFSCNTITPGPIQVWRLQSTLSILAGLSYHTQRTVWNLSFLTSICSGQWKTDCVGNIFLAMTPSYKLWNSGPHPLVQIFTSAACRVLFIAGDSA